jgi:hypothetical protein
LAILAIEDHGRKAVRHARIVPMLADEGMYLGSESSMARVLKARGQSARGGAGQIERPQAAGTTVP